MFTTILFYFIVVMFVAGALINFVLWLIELKENYQHKRIMHTLAEKQLRIEQSQL